MQTNDIVAGILLNLIPCTSSWSSDDIWPWLDNLESWGILENSWNPNVTDTAGPEGGPAGWFSRVALYQSTPRQRLYDLLEAMADRLREENEPLEIYRSSSYGSIAMVDVNLLDLALTLKIPVADPPSDLKIDLVQWAIIYPDDQDARDRPRDPVAVAADERFSETLLAAVSSAAGAMEFETAAEGKTALRETRKKWLLGVIANATGGGLPDAEHSLERLSKQTSPERFSEFPDAWEQLQKISLLPALKCTIQSGMIDEYGWPCLEEVVERFTGPLTTENEFETGKKRPRIFGAFPYAIVTDDLTAVVVRGNEVVLEAEITVPSGHKLANLHFVDGDLIVEARQGYQGVKFWNSNPKVTTEGWSHSMEELQGHVIDLADGGTFRGEKIVYSGDMLNLESNSPMDWFFDGQHFYRTVWHDNNGEMAIRAVDPLTGENGRKSMPAFFEDFITDEASLELGSLQMLNYGNLVKQSPLGSRGGVIGFRVRRHKSGLFDCEGIDGRAINAADMGFVALLSQPASDQFLPIGILKRGYRGQDSLCVRDPSGTACIAELHGGIGPYNRGQAAGSPLLFLHYLSIRDAAASKKLRKITDRQAQSLIDSARQDFDASKTDGSASEGTGYPNLDAAIRKLLPKLKSDRLHIGLRAIIIRYGQEARKLERLISNRNPDNTDAKATVSGADKSIQPTMDKLQHRCRVTQNTSLFDAAAQVAAFLQGKTDLVVVPKSTLDLIHHGMKTLPQNAWSLYWLQNGKQDTGWRTFLEALAETGLLDLSGKLRITTANVGEQLPFERPKTEGGKLDLSVNAVSLVQGNCRYLITKDWRQLQILEYAPDGNFQVLKAITSLNDSAAFDNTWTSEKLRQFVDLAASTEQQLPEPALINEIAEKLGLSAAEVGLVWLGYPNMKDYSSNFMPKHLREGLKLKTKEVASAKGALNSLSEEVRHQLVAEMLNGPVEDFFQKPPEKIALRLQTAWQKLKPNRLEISAEMVKVLREIIRQRPDSPDILVALNDAAVSHRFSSKTKWKFAPTVDNDSDLKHDSTEPPFDAEALQIAAFCIPWLAYTLPVGAPARSRMVDVHAATLTALDNPNLLMNPGTGYLYSETDKEAPSKAIEAAVGKLKQVNGIPVADDGIVAMGWMNHRVSRAFRPAKLKTEKQITKLQQQLDTTTANGNARTNAVVSAVQQIRSKQFRETAKRIEKTPVPAGQYESNPSMSCPRLVSKVSEALSVSENAAAYYLQLLTLADPTDRNIKMWNGWTTVTIKKAAQELIGAETILEAKRARAGRKYFLPGGWEGLKAPFLPLETWKLVLFQIERNSAGQIVPPLPRILPLEPVHLLFEKAWQRVVDGDQPKYEEVN